MGGVVWNGSEAAAGGRAGSCGGGGGKKRVAWREHVRVGGPASVGARARLGPRLTSLALVAGGDLDLDRP